VVVLPALQFAVLEVCRRVLDRRGQPPRWWHWRQRGPVWLAALLGGGSVLAFVGGYGPSRGADLWDESRHWEQRLDYIQSHFPPDQTWILSTDWYREFGWYLPDYHTTCIPRLLWSDEKVPPQYHNVYTTYHRSGEPKRWYYPSGYRPSPLSLPPGVRWLVFSPEMGWVYKGRQPYQTLRARDEILDWLPVAPGQQVVYGYGWWRLEPELEPAAG